MREKLIELIKEGNGGYDFMSLERIADHLLANGVIVPPVAIGQTVWLVHYGKIEETSVEKVVLKDGGLYLKLLCNSFYETTCRSIGKTVFLSREDAEKALKAITPTAKEDE